MRTALGEIPDRLLRDMSLAEAHEYLTARRGRPTRRTFLKGVGMTAGLASAGPLLWRQPARATGLAPAGLHVAHGADPGRQVVVSWSSPPGVNPTFRFGSTAGALEPTEPVTRTVAGVADRAYHHAVLDDLAPDTAYLYEVAHPGSPARTGSFTTAAPVGDGFRFATLGDMGATDAGAKVTARIVEADPDLVFFVGDLCYADRLGGAVEPMYDLGPIPKVQQDLAAWDAWLNQIEPSASRIPWMFTTGNHEMEVGQGPLGYDGFLARMHVPSSAADRPYYSFRYQNVAFVSLDANEVSYQIPHNQGYTLGAQDQWLAATLTALRGDPLVDFIVAGFHHCMYCSNAFHGSDGGPRDRWGHLFDEHGVDLVVNGHNHSYERTHPVRAGEPTRDDTFPPAGDGEAPTIQPAVDGTVYVTAGGGGQAAYPTTAHPASTVWTPDGLRMPELSTWSAVRYLGDHSVLVVDVAPAHCREPATMRCQAIAVASSADGSARVVDRFTLERAPAPQGA